MKTIILIVIACFLIVLAFHVAGISNYEEDYCTCLGHQPYISTRWNGECITYVFDPFGNFNGDGMVQYLYDMMEYCR